MPLLKKENQTLVNSQGYLRACFQIEVASGILVKALADGKSQPGPYF